MLKHQIQRYGWVPDSLDHRDHLYSVPSHLLSNRPAVASLRPKCPPVYDQGQVGSCTGNGVAAVFEFNQIRLKLPIFRPSRLFIYYNERAMEGTVGEDAGAQIRDGIKAVANLGVCSEVVWPYIEDKWSVKPPLSAYTAAVKHRAVQYARVPQTVVGIESCIAAGEPIVFGFTVFAQFESQQCAKDGIVQLPQRGDKPEGGHCVVAVGYDSKRQLVECRNSWGEEWGDHGYFFMPYQYILNPNLADDFWKITVVN